MKACDVLIPDKASKRFLFSSPGFIVDGCTDRNHPQALKAVLCIFMEEMSKQICRN